MSEKQKLTPAESREKRLNFLILLAIGCGILFMIYMIFGIIHAGLGLVLGTGFALLRGATG